MAAMWQIAVTDGAAYDLACDRQDRNWPVAVRIRQWWSSRPFGKLWKVQPLSGRDIRLGR
jgi:hypothetical protein